MNDEKLMELIRQYAHELKNLKPDSDPPRGYVFNFRTICKHIEELALDTAKINYVLELEEIFQDFKRRWVRMRQHDDEDIKYQEEIFEKLDHYLAKFKDIKDEKRADENLEVEKDNLIESRGAKILARRANKIAITAIVIACLGTIVGILVTVFLHVFGSN
ncbi:MAG: hypothetical protein HZR80_16885 [Candidatus Heimdallarchaeota archaeon]